jgi:hypothetical protein
MYVPAVQKVQSPSVYAYIEYLKRQTCDVSDPASQTLLRKMVGPPAGGAETEDAALPAGCSRRQREKYGNKRDFGNSLLAAGTVIVVACSSTRATTVRPWYISLLQRADREIRKLSLGE